MKFKNLTNFALKQTKKFFFVNTHVYPQNFYRKNFNFIYIRKYRNNNNFLILSWKKLTSKINISFLISCRKSHNHHLTVMKGEL